ncbi:MAG: hypothetical protein NTW87_09480 [Planctomycetota bacterium]|nr:hypothetical protein [Planctomycetota bacterium]
MARKGLHIVANEATKRVLASLGSPLVQVAVKGRVVESGSANTLVIENVSTSKSTTLPIIASPITKKALGDLAGVQGSHEVTLLGRVIQTASGNVLLLDRVGKAQSLPIVANEATRKVLSDLAKEKGGEITVKAKVVEQRGNKILVLASEGSKGGKRR